MNIPYTSFGNDELVGKPELGKTITCPHCGKVHDIQYRETLLPDETTKPSKALAFYNCGEKVYLVGVNAKNIL